MEILTLGGLRVRRIVKSDTNPQDHARTIVLLHGFGAPGDDLVALADMIDAPNGTVFLFPEAPHSLQDFIFQPLMGDSRAWWMIDIAAMERAIARNEMRDLSKTVPEGLAEARASLDAMLDAVEGDVVLGGFSQGAMLSMDVALRNPSRKLAGLVQLSGTFLAEHEWTPLMKGRAGLPVFQSHGDSDPILPFVLAEQLRDALTGAGVNVSFEAFHGPHAIPPSTLSRLSAWLRSLV